MAIDTQTETILSLSDAARRFPAYRRGKPITTSCVMRWILQGVKSPAGLVRLEAFRCGGRWLTSSEAIQRFTEAQTPNLNQPATLPRSAYRRTKDSENAERELVRDGW